MCRVGYKHTLKTRQKMSKAHKGFHHTSESRKKMADSRRGIYVGDRNGRWKGGLIDNGLGYLLRYAPHHPYANNRGYVQEHRLVMEKHIGRFLLPTERVHHINGDKKDNRIENLQLFSGDYEHRMYHVKTGGKNGRIEKR